MVRGARGVLCTAPLLLPRLISSFAKNEKINIRRVKDSEKDKASLVGPNHEASRRNE